MVSRAAVAAICGLLVLVSLLLVLMPSSGGQPIITTTTPLTAPTQQQGVGDEKATGIITAAAPSRNDHFVAAGLISEIERIFGRTDDDDDDDDDEKAAGVGGEYRHSPCFLTHNRLRIPSHAILSDDTLLPHGVEPCDINGTFGGAPRRRPSRAKTSIATAVATDDDGGAVNNRNQKDNSKKKKKNKKKKFSSLTWKALPWTWAATHCLHHSSLQCKNIRDAVRAGPLPQLGELMQRNFLPPAMMMMGQKRRRWRQGRGTGGAGLYNSSGNDTKGEKPNDNSRNNKSNHNNNDGSGNTSESHYDDDDGSRCCTFADRGVWKDGPLPHDLLDILQQRFPSPIIDATHTGGDVNDDTTTTTDATSSSSSTVSSPPGLRRRKTRLPQTLEERMLYPGAVDQIEFFVEQLLASSASSSSASSDRRTTSTSSSTTPNHRRRHAGSPPQPTERRKKRAHRHQLNSQQRQEFADFVLGRHRRAHLFREPEVSLEESALMFLLGISKLPKKPGKVFFARQQRQRVMMNKSNNGSSSEAADSGNSMKSDAQAVNDGGQQQDEEEQQQFVRIFVPGDSHQRALVSSIGSLMRGMRRHFDRGTHAAMRYVFTTHGDYFFFSREASDAYRSKNAAESSRTSLEEILPIRLPAHNKKIMNNEGDDDTTTTRERVIFEVVYEYVNRYKESSDAQADKFVGAFTSSFMRNDLVSLPRWRRTGRRSGGGVGNRDENIEEHLRVKRSSASAVLLRPFQPRQLPALNSSVVFFVAPFMKNLAHGMMKMMREIVDGFDDPGGDPQQQQQQQSLLVVRGLSSDWPFTEQYQETIAHIVRSMRSTTTPSQEKQPEGGGGVLVEDVRRHHHHDVIQKRMQFTPKPHYMPITDLIGHSGQCIVVGHFPAPAMRFTHTRWPDLFPGKHTSCTDWVSAKSWFDFGLAAWLTS